jgi:hypothetical protein
VRRLPSTVMHAVELLVVIGKRVDAALALARA